MSIRSYPTGGTKSGEMTFFYQIIPKKYKYQYNSFCLEWFSLTYSYVVLISTHFCLFSVSIVVSGSLQSLGTGRYYPTLPSYK